MTASAGETAALPAPQTTPPRPDSALSGRAARSRLRRTSSRWATLLARIYHNFPLVCPRCRQSMRLIASLTDPFSIRDVLTHLEEPVRPPPLRPARAPPTLALGFAEVSPEEMDQTPAVDPAEPEPIPAYEINQTRSW